MNDLMKLEQKHDIFVDFPFMGSSEVGIGIFPWLPCISFELRKTDNNAVEYKSTTEKSFRFFCVVAIRTAIR
jgi:hypothetical protein